MISMFVQIYIHVVPDSPVTQQSLCLFRCCATGVNPLGLYTYLMCGISVVSERSYKARQKRNRERKRNQGTTCHHVYIGDSKPDVAVASDCRHYQHCLTPPRGLKLATSSHQNL